MEFDYHFCQREAFGVRHCFVLINSLTENHQVIGKLDHLNKSVLFDDCQDVLRNNDTRQLFVPRPSGGIFLDGPAFGTAVGQLISSAQGPCGVIWIRGLKEIIF